MKQAAPPTDRLLGQLDARRRLLQMTKSDLARHAGVPVVTIRRLLSGADVRPRMDTLAAIAGAMGVEVCLSDKPHVRALSTAPAFRAGQARAKAERLASLVEGTMALEAEAIDASVVAEMVEHSTHVLLAGPPRRLWAAEP